MIEDETYNEEDIGSIFNRDYFEGRFGPLYENYKEVIAINEDEFVIYKFAKISYTEIKLIKIYELDY
jgi:hypothetical protein